MPYYLREIGSDDGSSAVTTTESIGPFDTRSSAYAAIPDNRRSELKIAFIATDSERAEWSDRERSRFADGTYREVPWSSVDVHPLHFVHLSDEAGYVAYTADDEAGCLNRKLRVRPGKYLEKFYAHVSLSTRNEWIRLVSFVDDAFKIATTADDIETVFAYGPQSCMGPKRIEPCDRYPHGRTLNFDPYPVRVYGDSDLAVAYLGPMDRAIARTVIHPGEKTYSTIYPNQSGDGPHGSRLETLLVQAGYRHGSMDGARIRAIRHRHGGWVMPWIDGVDRCSHDGGRWIVLGDGPIEAQSTCGYVDDAQDEPDESACDHCSDYFADDDLRDGLCESCHDSRHSCGHCDRYYFADDSDDSGYCDSCESDRQYCECCNEDSWEEFHFSESRDEWVCDDCATSHEDSRFNCEHCDERTTEWTMDRSRQLERIANGSSCRFCDECEPIVVVCHACAIVYERAESPNACPDCGIAPRCEDTGDLLATIDDAHTHDRAMAILADRLSVDDAIAPGAAGCAVPVPVVPVVPSWVPWSAMGTAQNSDDAIAIARTMPTDDDGSGYYWVDDAIANDAQ